MLLNPIESDAIWTNRLNEFCLIYAWKPNKILRVCVRSFDASVCWYFFCHPRVPNIGEMRPHFDLKTKPLNFITFEHAYENTLITEWICGMCDAISPNGLIQISTPDRHHNYHLFLLIFVYFSFLFFVFLSIQFTFSVSFCVLIVFVFIFRAPIRAIGSFQFVSTSIRCVFRLVFALHTNIVCSEMCHCCN